MVWDPDLRTGGQAPEQIRRAKILLWNRPLLSAYQMFQLSRHPGMRGRRPRAASSFRIRTSVPTPSHASAPRPEYIVNPDQEAPPNTHWLAGTELNLVRPPGQRGEGGGRERWIREANGASPTMQRIDPQHLAWIARKPGRRQVRT